MTCSDSSETYTEYEGLVCNCLVDKLCFVNWEFLTFSMVIIC